MSTGFVKLFRKIMNTSFYKKPNTSHLAHHLIYRANRFPTKMIFNDKEIELQSGELITGRRVLSNETGLSEQETRTSLKILVNTGFLTIKTTNKFSIIRIKKYSDYQNGNSKVTSTLTNQQPTSNQPVTTDKKYKKEKKEENGKPFSSESIKIVEHLYSCILKEKPDFKIPEKNGCSKEAEKMIRIDKRNLDTIIQVIDYATSDDFWKSNILSIYKLRKQFDRLEMQMKKSRGDKEW